MNKKWVSYKNDYAMLKQVSKWAEAPELIGAVLLNRKIDTESKVREFLSMEVTKLTTPDLLNDMEDAKDRILIAIEGQEKILIYGDYDVDGITSTTVLLKFLKHVGCSADYYIPDRFDEGYGLNIEAAKEIISKKYDLVITVDCGITAVDIVEYLNDNSIDVIITDHHACGETLPGAIACINPARHDSTYPFPFLAGVGVAYKLLCALALEMDCVDYVDSLLDIVAIGTVADVVSLTEENRKLVRKGLELLKNTDNVGVKSLLDNCNIALEEISTYDIAFKIAPRLNAAGRMCHASICVELLMEENKSRAEEIVARLNELNTQRKSIEEKIKLEAIEQIDKLGRDKKVLILWGADWHLGVLGIIASKLVEQFQRPVILMCEKDGLLKGSGRSTSNINIYETLTASKEYILQYGGHSQAAGLTIKKEYLADFSKKMCDTINDLNLEEEKPSILVDYKIVSSDLNVGTINFLKRLEPHGCDNPKPVFVYRNLIIKSCRTVGKDNNHLSMVLTDQEKDISAIGFQMGEYMKLLSKGQKIDIVCSMELNIWNNTERIQLNIYDLNIKK